MFKDKKAAGLDLGTVRECGSTGAFITLGHPPTKSVFFKFVLLFYIDYTMRNQIHNIYDIYGILY